MTLYLKTLALVSLLLSQVFANDELSDFIPSQESAWDYFGEVQIRAARREVKANRAGISDTKLLNYNALQLHLNYTNDGFYFEATPYAYGYRGESDFRPSGPNFSEPFSKQDFFFRTLYASYSVGKLTFGMGVLPMSNSFPNQFKRDYYQDGEGINILSDIDPLAIFMKYKISEDNQILFGAGYIDTHFVPSGKYYNQHNLHKTYGIFAKQIMYVDKFQILNDLTYTKAMYNKKDAGEFYGYGFGISWDDSEYSGLTVYNTLGLSLYKNNSINVQSDILSDLGLGAVPPLYAANFSFDTNRYTGAANLLGFRKDIDYFDFESFINLEWFHVMGDWTSANKGSPYHGDGNYMSNIRDNSYYIAYGIKVNRDISVRLSYSYMEFDEKENIGAPSSVPSENSYGPQLSSINLTKLIFYYNF